jgi:hypothetical protein
MAVLTESIAHSTSQILRIQAARAANCSPIALSLILCKGYFPLYKSTFQYKVLFGKLGRKSGQMMRITQSETPERTSSAVFHRNGVPPKARTSTKTLGETNHSRGVNVSKIAPGRRSSCSRLLAANNTR